MNQAKQKLFTQLKTVFPQPHLMKDAPRRISWSVALYVSKVEYADKEVLKSTGNLQLAEEYVKWFKEQHNGGH